MFNPGQLVYVDYGEGPPQVVHTRLVLGHIVGYEHMIRTPDGDCYVEILDASNPDYVSFHVGPDDGTLPAGVPAGAVYGFPPMTLAQFQRLLAEGRTEVLAELQRRGLPLPLAAGPAQPAQMIWVLAEYIPGHPIGEPVTPPLGHAREGDYGLMPMIDKDGATRPVLIRRIDPEQVPAFCEERIGLARQSEAQEGGDKFAAEDVRTLEVKFAASGERQRSFKETVAEMVQTEFDDFPLEPRTALPYLRAVSSVAESAFAQHLGWVSQSKIPEGDRAIHENEVLSRALDLAISYDSLNVANLASFELLIRRKQLLAEAHAYNPSAPSYEGSDHFLGTSYRPGGAIVVPELTEHVSKKLHQESQILKEKRKQVEFKEFKGKGGGRGGKGLPPQAKAKPGRGEGGGGS